MTVITTKIRVSFDVRNLKKVCLLALIKGQHFLYMLKKCLNDFLLNRMKLPFTSASNF